MSHPVHRDERGFVLTGTEAAHDLSDLSLHPHETSVPGLFAVGDVRAGSVKRVASAVGEGSVVVSEVHQGSGPGFTVYACRDCAPHFPRVPDVLSLPPAPI